MEEPEAVENRISPEVATEPQRLTELAMSL